MATRIPPIPARVAGLDWPRITADLDTLGHATTGPLLTGQECAELAELYAQDLHFRSRIVMARHGFGQGEYRYLRYPLPEPVQALRHSVWPHLASLANRWNVALGQEQNYPSTLDEYLARCHAAGQTRPTPLLLTYGPGDYNRLHQDVYGALVFPMQMTVLLSDPGHHFTGGEFVLVEQGPRMQSRAEVVTLQQGEAVIFAVRERPQRGTRGFYRVQLRHGVSRIRSGRRMTMGIIFHDAA